MAWPIVCRPTHLGGLGILDLRFFGFALRLRWEWLRRTDPGRCWADLPCRGSKPVEAMSASSTSVIIGDGASALLWTDRWAPFGPLCTFAPDLFVAVSRAGKRRSVKDGLAMNC